MNKSPIVEAYKTKEFTCKQSKFDVAPALPLRGMICSPSGGGKTVLLTNFILNIYRDCFERIYIFSPSIDVDNAWDNVKDYIRDKIRPFPNEKIYFDHYNPDDLEEIIETQKKVIEIQKEQKHKQLFQILIVIDDFADDTNFTRKSTLLHQLYIRGRHNYISTLTSTQVYRQISPIVRKNMTHLFVFRLRNQADLEAITEEVSAVYGKSKFQEMYNTATSEPFAFLYINMMAKNKEDMFYMNFTHKLIPE
jgi:HEPN domain-containing protein